MIIYIVICLIIVALTRFLAYWGINFLKINDITLIQDVLYFSYVENRGAAFGIFQNSKIFLVSVALLLFIFISFYIYKNKNMKLILLIALSLIAGGGISNLIDRLTFGYVVDYIDFRIINYPVFNLADICVVCGTAILAYYMIFLEVKDKNNENN
jgi:signal peptidase II